MGKLIDEVRFEIKAENDHINEICQPYILRLTEYHMKMFKVIEDNIDSILELMYKRTNPEKKMSDYKFFGKSFQVKSFGESWRLYTDGKVMFKLEYGGDYRLYKNAFEKYKLLCGKEMIDAIIELNFPIYDDMSSDIDNHHYSKEGIKSSIRRLQGGVVTYSYNNLSVFEPINKFLAVSAEQRVKDWLKLFC